MKLRYAAAHATWTDARIELLKQLWGGGASCSQIATALGGVSRNAVIGKVHRLALPKPERKPARPLRRARRRPQARFTPIVHSTMGNSGEPGLPARACSIAARARKRARLPRVACTVALDQFNAAIPSEQRRTLLQLTRSSCRWPVGEPGKPEFFFCGGRVEMGHPYCAGHCDFAYQQEERPCAQSTYAAARSAARSSRISRLSARG